MEHAVVYHIRFGRGAVCAQDGKTVRVRFDDAGVGEKSFVYPDAFGAYLRFDDAARQRDVQTQLEAEREADRQAAEERAAQRAAAIESIREEARAAAAEKRKTAPRRRKAAK